MASDRMLRGQLPWGLGGAVYLLIRSFVRDCLFINIRSLILSIGGKGMLLRAIHPYWIARCLVGGSSCIVKGYQNSGFRDLTIPCENFSLPPTLLPTTTTRPYPHALCDVSALALL